MRQIECEECGAPTWVEGVGCTHCGAKDLSQPPRPIAAHPVTARCAWEVQAGVLPGQPEAEFTKRWFMSSEDPDEKFRWLHNQAMAHADSLTDPSKINWVRLDWVWF